MEETIVQQYARYRDEIEVLQDERALLALMFIHERGPIEWYAMCGELGIARDDAEEVGRKLNKAGLLTDFGGSGKYSPTVMAADFLNRIPAGVTHGTNNWLERLKKTFIVLLILSLSCVGIAGISDGSPGAFLLGLLLLLPITWFIVAALSRAESVWPLKSMAFVGVILASSLIITFVGRSRLPTPASPGSQVTTLPPPVKSAPSSEGSTYWDRLRYECVILDNRTFDPIRDATIRLKPQDGEILREVSDNTGRAVFYFRSHEPEATVVVHAPGYRDARKYLRIDGPDSFGIIPLERISPRGEDFK